MNTCSECGSLVPLHVGTDADGNPCTNAMFHTVTESLAPDFRDRSNDQATGDE
jgi:hypothetical protein